METFDNFNSKVKSYWNRPEGTTGMIILVLGAIAVVWGWGNIVSFLADAAENTVKLIVCVGFIAGAGYVVFDPQMRTLIAYMYKSITRAITGIFVTIDPIGILKSYIASLVKGLRNMQAQIDNLRGQMAQLKLLIERNERDRTKALNLVREAREQNKNTVLVLKARQAGRLKDSNITLQDLYRKMEILLRVLMKMHETSEVLVDDIKSEVDVKTRERAAIRASYSAFKSALRIVRGQTNERDLYDQAMEFLAADYGQKLGEIESFIEMSRGFIDTVDLQNGVYEADALKQIEDWEKRGDSILLGGEKQALLAAAYDDDNLIDLPTAPERVAIPAKVGGSDDYGDLFKTGRN